MRTRTKPTNTAEMIATKIMNSDALGAPIDAVAARILADIRPHLPATLQGLPDDRLLALVNWSIIAAWNTAARKFESPSST